MRNVAFSALAISLVALAVAIGAWIVPEPTNIGWGVRFTFICIAVACVFGAIALLIHLYRSHAYYKEVLRQLSIFQHRAITIQRRCNNDPGLAPLPPGRSVFDEYLAWNQDIHTYLAQTLGAEFESSFERVHGVPTSIPQNQRVFNLVEQYAKNLDSIIAYARTILL